MTVGNFLRAFEVSIKELKSEVKDLKRTHQKLNCQFMGIQTRDVKKTLTRYTWPHILADYDLPQFGTGKWQKQQQATTDS